MSPPSSPYDTDDDLTEDMEGLRRACILRSSTPNTVDTDSDTKSGGNNTDIDLLRRLKDRFSHPSAAPTSAASPPMIMPFSARGMYNSDGGDDVETLRAIQRRWRNTLHPDRKKVGRWSVDEDKRLKVAVMLFGARSWNKIAQFAPGRTQVQCRERWLNCLDPSLNLEPWTEEEDAKLLSALAEHGYSWSKVAMCIPPRTDNQCRGRWKTLVPKEVPVLQAVKKMKRAVLISNFVDREGERPLIGPSDFLAVLPHTAEVGNNNTVEKKTPKKSRAKSKRSIEKKVKADGTLNSSADTVPSDSYLIVGLSSTGAESGSLKRSGKEPSSDNLPNKSRDKSEHFLEQKLEADPMTNLSSKVSVDYSLPLPCSNSVTNASASMKRTLKRTSSCELPKMSRVKHGSSLEGNITEDGTTKPSTEAAVATLSYVPCVNTSSVERGSNKDDNRESIKESWSC